MYQVAAKGKLPSQEMLFFVKFSPPGRYTAREKFIDTIQYCIKCN